MTIRRLLFVNLALAGLQPFSAGLSMSGFGGAITVHAVGALALQIGALVQAVTAVVLWRRGRAPAWMTGFSIGLFVMVFLELAAGHNRLFWLHLPLGVGIVAGLLRHVSGLNTSR